MVVLECSTRGCALGKKFSAFNAYTLYGGKNNSIEEHYQACKRFNGEQLPRKQAKGKQPTTIVIYDKEFEVSFLTPFYYLLWFKFYNENPQLIEQAKEYDDFSDMFKGRSINCQADTLRLFIRDRSKYIEIIKPLALQLGM